MNDNKQKIYNRHGNLVGIYYPDRNTVEFGRDGDYVQLKFPPGTPIEFIFGNDVPAA